MRCRVLVAPLALSVGATFDGEVRTLIARLKYRHQREIGGLLAARLAPLLSGTDFDFVTAVPVAPSRLRSRGYNQAEQIARPLAVKLGLPYRHVLFRAKNVRQVGKSSSQRQLQSRNAFIAPPLPLLTRILLVDDVMTTGATLNECAKALVKSSNAKVWVAVAARKDRG